MIAEEARRLPAQRPRPARESRRRGWLLLLPVGLAAVGPFVAEMSGPDWSLPIAVGSCGLAGLLAALIDRGIRGALTALALPLISVVVAAGLELASGRVEPPSAYMFPFEFVVVTVFLIQATSAWAGYLVGRLVAGVVRRLTSAASAR